MFYMRSRTKGSGQGETADAKHSRRKRSIRETLRDIPVEDEPPREASEQGDEPDGSREL